MSCHKMFVESRFQPCFLAFAVEFRFVLFASAVHVFSRFTIVACTQRGDVRWSSSPQAAPAVYSIANSISPATDLVLRVFAWHTFHVSTLVPPERICVYQSLFRGFPCSLDDLNGEGFSATSSHLLLLALHQLLKLRPWCGWDEDAICSSFSSYPAIWQTRSSPWVCRLVVFHPFLLLESCYNLEGRSEGFLI